MTVDHDEAFKQLRNAFLENNYTIMDPEDVHALLRNVRRILSRDENAPTSQAIASGFVRPMILALKHYQDIDESSKIEIMWILTNIASGPSDNVCYLLKQGILPIAMDILRKNTNEELLLQTLWMLGNITGDGPIARDIVLRLGFATKLIEIFNSIDLSQVNFIRVLVWVMSNMLRDKPFADFDFVAALIPSFHKALQSDDHQILEDTLYGLSYFSEREDNNSGEVLMHSISLLRIIHLANPDMYSDKIFSPALRIIGNLATGSANLCKALLDAGCIDLLKKLIWHPVEIVRKEALWALSNLSASDDFHHLDRIIESGILQDVITLVNSSEDSQSIIIESLWVLNNTAHSAHSKSLLRVAREGYIWALAHALSFANVNETIYLLAFDSLEICLKSAEYLKITDIPKEWPEHIRTCNGNVYVTLIRELGILDLIKSFATQQHFDKIRERASFILYKYFTAEEVKRQMVGGTLSCKPTLHSETTAGATPNVKQVCLDNDVNEENFDNIIP